MTHELDLSRRFLSLLAEMGIEGNPAEEAWTLIRSAYAGKVRFYHNLDHIDAMLRHLDAAGIIDPSMELGIWYHDVVYDPRAADNEEKSAAFFRDGIGPALPVGIADKVCRLILATDHRLPRSENEDEALIRDIDLSILAGDAGTYQNYTTAIRKEYVHVPEHAYREGRGRVLRKFLERRIFYSDRFSGMEADARRNIQEELAALDREELA